MLDLYPRKAIIPLSVAEQISLLKQGKPISSTSFYSSQNLALIFKHSLNHLMRGKRILKVELKL
jgi:hypothetical protein